jgi:hypothetical protein
MTKKTEPTRKKYVPMERVASFRKRTLPIRKLIAAAKSTSVYQSS